jgi:hypothetical protein
VRRPRLLPEVRQGAGSGPTSCSPCCPAGAGSGPEPARAPAAAAGDEYSSQTTHAIEKRARSALQNALAKGRLELGKQGWLHEAVRPARSLQEAMQQRMSRLQQLHGL